MKIYKLVILLAGLIFSVQAAVCAADPEFNPRPELPVAFPQTVAGSYVFYRGVTNAPAQVARMFSGTASSRYMSGFKGRFVESIMNKAAQTVIFPNLSGWKPITPARLGASGIDGLLIRTDARGNIRGALVVEAKAFGSQPGNSQYGAQMSASWQQKWFADTAVDYRSFGEQLSKASALIRTQGTSIPSNAKSVLLANSREVKVWFEENRLMYSGDGPDVSLREVQRATSNTAKYLSGMAEGKISWRDRYFRYSTENGEHVFTISKVDRVTGKEILGSGQVIKGTYDTLPRDYQEFLDDAIPKEIRRLRPNAVDDEVEAFVKQAKNDPDFLRTLQPNRSLNWRSFAKETAYTGVKSVGLATATDVVIQLIVAGSVDWNQTARIAVTGVLAGTAGSAMSQMTTYFLTADMVTKNLTTATNIQPWFSRMAGVFGGATGMLGATAIFSYFPYLMGWVDVHTANSSFATGTAFTVGGALAAGGALTLAKLGVAGTGVVISNLSGIAATNAGLAALGGGSLASGGGGMALGSTILATTQVVGVVIMAGVVGYQGWTYIKGHKNQILMIDQEFELRQNNLY